MKNVILAAAVAGASAAPSFSEWAKEHGKTYATREELVLRRAIFAANVAKVQKHNAETALGKHTYTMGLNSFADLLGEEWKARMTGGYRAKEQRSQNVNLSLLRPANANPASVDWSAQGAVTPIKNQGQCGSCWAFSTTGSVEGITFIKTGQLLSLSEQQLMDCSGAQGNMSCEGGLMDYAFQYIIANGGIASEASYPYKAVDESCTSPLPKSVATIANFVDVPASSETALETAIVQQPISVAVEADQDSFQLYAGGVMTAACGSNLDHGVLAVGYGTDAANGGDYYKVKNSWGASWGESGYIRLGRGATFNPDGQCGIQLAASYPTK